MRASPCRLLLSALLFGAILSAPPSSGFQPRHHLGVGARRASRLAAAPEANGGGDGAAEAEQGRDPSQPPYALSGLGAAQTRSGYNTERPYSRTLAQTKKKKMRQGRRRWRRKLEDLEDDEMLEDGYEPIMHKRRPFYRRWSSRAASWLRHGGKDARPEPGTLILVRHGESLWNQNKTFTGWADPDLSPQGYREVEHAARLLVEGGYKIDCVFTSRLKRAVRSVWMILQERNEVYLPVFKSWRLNERHYGALTGLSKSDTAKRLGQELVQEWRGSLRSRPPALARNDRYWPGRERTYADLPSSDIPLTESLLDCMKRTSPVWEEKIREQIKMGRNVLVVAHANTLRGLVKLIDKIGDNEIQEVAIPTGIPIIYKFDKDMNPVPPPPSADRLQQAHMSGLFLEKPGLLKDALKREEDWCNEVPGYTSTMQSSNNPLSSTLNTLNKLQAQRELGDWAQKLSVNPDGTGDVDEDDGSDGNSGKPIAWIEDQVWEKGVAELGEGIAFDPDYPPFRQDLDVDMGGTDAEDEEDAVSPAIYRAEGTSPCMQALPAGAVSQNLGSVSSQKDSIIVIIRHGKTEHNKLGLFTGWEDVPLAKDGVVEAREAGRLLRDHGFEFDVVYVSWLSRAIETAWHVLDELDCLWLPIIKTWRLNERMYGDLTGLSKKMVAQRHGEEQFKAWRRGYKVRPPSVSSFSPNYPGNDPRYNEYMDDVRYSFSESLIRSIEGNKISLHRKLPKAESLFDCMSRTIPFYTRAIVPEAIDQGKRVLISSSENAIRGLLMHLCDIPEEMITQLEIPNGLPLIYDLDSKCLKLLDDGSGIDPLEKYDFGKAGKYLFQNCSDPDECDITFDGTARKISEEDRATIDFIRNPKLAVEKESVKV
jgi:2,3-bisphosphoglycerate-dependent phosphoglycerate mutase